MDKKPNVINSQLDMFAPVQLGMDLRPQAIKHQEPTSKTVIIEFTKIENYCMDVLAWGGGCGEYTPFDMAVQYNQEHGSHIDWHEFSNALDHLHMRNFIELVGHNRDGMTIYSKK